MGFELLVRGLVRLIELVLLLRRFVLRLLCVGSVVQEPMLGGAGQRSMRHAL